ncbi:MAG TPA: hypothetical protein DFR83_27265 [Deltaproteobacteria bacterium]|mgnify:CR=1 FL=1|nr:hypothetical protein [Deltaproteobacteria bacterium]
MVRRAGWTALLWVVLFVLGPAPAGAVDRLRVDAWGRAAGLPQGTVTSMVRDDAGYLWVGTFAGLFRFSGQQFEEQVARPEVYARVARITALSDAPDGLWIGVEGGGVWSFVDGEFVQVKQPEELRSATIWDLAIPPSEGSEEDRLLVGASSGLWRYGEQSGWTRLSDEPAFHVLPLDADTLWVGNQTMVWRQAGMQADAPTATGGFFGLWRDPDGDIWAAERNGPVLIPTSGAPLRDSSWGYHLKLGVAPSVDASGRMWFGTDQGVLVLEDWAEAKARLKAGNPLQPILHRLESSPRSLLVDADDTVWVGTKTAGLYRFTTTPFSQIPLPDGALAETTGPLARSGDTTWISLDCEQVHAWQAGAWSAVVDVSAFPVEGGASRCVTALAADRNGGLFVGQSGLVSRVVDGRRSSPPPGTPVLRPNETPSYIEVLDGGGIWMATNAGRVFQGWSSATDPLVLLPVPEELPRVLSRAVLADGRMVLGADDGIWILDGQRWSHSGCEEGFACGSVRDLMVDGAGVLWGATYGGGLGWLDGGEVGRITPAEHGLPEGFLSSVTLGPGGQAWIHGNRGLFMLGSEELDAVRRGILPRLQPLHFDVGEANGWAQPAALTDSEDRLWLVTVEGLVSYSLAAEVHAWTPGAVQIESVASGSVMLKPVHGRVVLTRDLPAALDISWSSPLLRPDQVSRYRYRLIRTSDDTSDIPFSEPMARTSVSFASLEPGAYWFEVMAVGADATEGEITRLQVIRAWLWSEHPGLPVAISVLCMTLAGALVVSRLIASERRLRTLSERSRAAIEAGRRLEALRRMYGDTLGSIGVAIFVLDGDGRCVEVNQQACDLFGIERSTLLTWTRVDLAPAVAQADRREFQRADGALFTATVKMTLFITDGMEHLVVSLRAAASPAHEVVVGPG